MIRQIPKLFSLLAVFFACVSLSAQDAKKPVLDGEQRLAWHKQHMQMQEDSPWSRMRWQHIGPEHMSGRVTDIAVPTDKPYTVYLSTASGGVWKSDNYGTTWKAIFDDAPSASVGTIAVAPSDSNVVYVGLGEANIFRSSMAGTGVYRSDDAGETWNYVGLVDTQQIARIVIHPKDPNTVYVAASGHEWTNNEERGVYKTTDGGKTWNRVLYINEQVAAIDLVMDPRDPDVLYASMWNRIRRKWSDPLPGPDDGIFKTTDGGENWEHLTNGLPQVDRAGRIGLCIAHSKPDTIYALIDNHEIARKARPGERDAYGRLRTDVIKGAEVFRSDDGGKNWVKASESSQLMTRLFSTYGWVFGQIRVDPNDENTLFIMGVPLLKSTDGGKTFRSIRARDLHGDHHAMWIDPNNSNRIINGNDGGVNFSFDGGETWKNDELLPVVQFYNVSFDYAEPFNVYGSIQDNNSWMGPSNYRPGRSNKTDWKRIPGGEASIIEVDPEDQNTLYSESFYGSIMRSTMNPRQTKSIKPQPGEGEPELRGQWLAPFILSPHNSRVVYHGMQYVFRSMDRGENWERISPDLTTNNPDEQGNISYQTITSISESPVKFGVLYAGTDDGRLHMTKNGGLEWTEILEGLPKNKWVSRVAASKYDEGTVYLTLNGKRDNDFQVYVYKSTDFGKTWEDISGNIPGGPVNVIHEDPKFDNVLYVGTDMGVYVSTDDGKNWNTLGSNLPIAFVHDLKVHPRDRVAVIATHGRGIWTLELNRLDRELGGGEAEGQPEEDAAEGRRNRFRRNRQNQEDGGDGDDGR